MFKIILAVCLVGSAIAAEPEVEVLRFGSQVDNDGTYGYEYELSNGVTAQESGIGGQYANGGFRHYSPEGELIELAYTADDAGFHPVAAHLPTPPPIPDHILKAIQYIESHPTPEEQQDRQVRQQLGQ
ncbi:pupal cuticle protein Edg-78E-like [Episyrphus balteatus]|uniref:pupal cuticle protein Edg-78E-like n=1 Tax=Episyrphus balteatus TaxID=286459 RepID=UPI00248596C1|nr:pupal cuticle protein Edg-78E-like [Episyrphus balteatus]